jgi:hypothetical protein
VLARQVTKSWVRSRFSAEFLRGKTLLRLFPSPDPTRVGASGSGPVLLCKCNVNVVSNDMPDLRKEILQTRFACSQDPNYDIRVTTKGGHVSVPATRVTAEALKPGVLT